MGAIKQKIDESHIENGHLPFKPEFQLLSLFEAELEESFSSNNLIRNDCFELIWVKKGSGTFSVDFKSYFLKSNSLYCIGPDQLRKIKLKLGSEGIFMKLPKEFVHLSDCQLDLSLLIANNDGVLVFENFTLEKNIEPVLEEIKQEYTNSHSFKTEIIRALLKVFFVYLCRQLKLNGENLEKSKDLNLIVRFFSLLKSNIRSKKLVSDYAELLCLTPNYLNSLVKKQTGHPAKYHIQQTLIMEAKRLALNSNFRLKEIADKLGFEDYAHFSKYFKSYSGRNFSDFKKNELSNQF